MKNILDAHLANPSGDESTFFSKKNLIRLIKFETVFFIYVFLNRIDAIKNIMNADDDLWGLMSLLTPYDFETGWTFLIILMLTTINYNFLFTQIRPIYWPLKVGGLLSLIITTNLNHWQINLNIFLIILFYLSHKTFANFKVQHDFKFPCIIVAILVALVFLYFDTAFVLLSY